MSVQERGYMSKPLRTIEAKGPDIENNRKINISKAAAYDKLCFDESDKKSQGDLPATRTEKIVASLMVLAVVYVVGSITYSVMFQ